jgi:hypothetical protein
MNLEGRGVPAGFVASTEFVEAANAQAKSLGINPASVFVPHPIQDRNDEEMVQLARAAIDEIVALICEKNSSNQETN